MLPFSTLYPVVLLYNLCCRLVLSLWFYYIIMLYSLVLSLWFYYISIMLFSTFPVVLLYKLMLPFSTFPVVKLLYRPQGVLNGSLVLSLWLLNGSISLWFYIARTTGKYFRQWFYYITYKY